MRPEDRSRNILIGTAVIIIIILVAIFLIRRQGNAPVVEAPVIPTPVSSYQQSLQNNYGITVPSSAIKSDLRDVTGNNQMGLATLDKETNQNEYTIIANLVNPDSGYFYQAWLINGNDVISLGKLQVGKAGWLINYTSTKDLSDHKAVWVTLEKVYDNTPEKHILEGSF
jgi:hypothetical protein